VMGPGYVIAGILHFIVPELYVQIIPPVLPAPLALVYLSGVAEIAVGIGVLIPNASICGLGDNRATRRDLSGERLHGNLDGRRRGNRRWRPVDVGSLGAAPTTGRVDPVGLLVHRRGSQCAGLTPTADRRHPNEPLCVEHV